MGKIKAAGDEHESVLSDKIDALRAYRHRFRVDAPLHALKQEIEFHRLIDPIYQIQASLADPKKFYRGLPDAHAAGDAREIQALVLYRFGYNDVDMGRVSDLLIEHGGARQFYSPSENAAQRKRHHHGAKMLFEDGYTAHERRIIQLVDPGFNFKANPKVSHETIAYNKSLNPTQSRNNHLSRMADADVNPRGAPKLRTELKKDIDGVMRGRKYWRVQHIYKACEVMDDLIVHLSETIPDFTNDPTIVQLKERYRFNELVASNSVRISSAFYVQLAAAIASAEQRGGVKRGYVPNDQLAINVMRHHWLYEKAKRAAGKISPHSKSLIFKSFQRFYSGAI